MTPEHNPFAVSDGVRRQIFTDRIVPMVLEPARASSRPPRALVVGGQPGAGKTRALAQIAPPTDFVVVNGDDLRAFHPQYDELMDVQPNLMPDATASCAGTWIQMSLAWAAAQRRNVAWETTFRSGDALIRDTLMFRAASYSVTVTALAVPGQVSLLGTVRRYCSQVGSYGAGRSVSLSGHDEPFKAALPLLERLPAAVPGITLRIVNRELRQIYPVDQETAADALRIGRWLSVEACEQLIVETGEVRGQLAVQSPTPARKDAHEVLNVVDKRLRARIALLKTGRRRGHGPDGPDFG